MVAFVPTNQGSGRIGVLARRVKGQGDALARTLVRVGTLMVGRTQKAFEDQGRAGKQWAPRKIPNVAGILRDLERSGRMPPARRFEPRPAAIDTGQLRASIVFTRRGRDSVEYGSRVAYANKVQQGEASTIAITDTMRKNLSKLLKRRKDLRAKLGFLFQLKQFTVKPPARPFVVFLPEDRRAAERIWREEVQKAGG